ncbi:MAG: hypothetical protein WC862_02625 [Patescibacteria group bacterium]
MLLIIIAPILKRKRYLLTAAGAALAMFALAYYLMLFNITDKSMAAYAYMNGAWHTIGSVALTALISIMFGLYSGVWLFRRDIMKARKKAGHIALSASGALGGLLAAGCPTCGAPLLALFGAPLALMSLPFKGLEIKVLSVILIFLSIYSLAESVYKQLARACKINAPILKNNL